MFDDKYDVVTASGFLVFDLMTWGWPRPLRLLSFPG
jgi:hypothetical protein